MAIAEINLQDIEKRLIAADEHWLTACRLSRDAQEEYLMAVREKRDPELIAFLRERMIGWKGVEDGATAMHRIIMGLNREDYE